MPRQVLTWMLRFATTEQVAKRTGITVTPAQAQKQLSDEKARARQAGDTLAEAAVINGLPPDLLPELGRWIAIQLKLQDRLDNGVAPTTAAAQQALQLKVNHVQCLAAKSLQHQGQPAVRRLRLPAVHRRAGDEHAGRGSRQEAGQPRRRS